MNRKRKRDNALSLIIAVLAGLLTMDTVVSAQTTNQPPAAPKRSQTAMSPLQMMKQSLDLADEQVQRLEPVFKEQQERLAVLRRNTTLSRQERVVKLKEMRTAADAKVKQHLTPAQLDKWHKGLRQTQLARMAGETKGGRSMPPEQVEKWKKLKEQSRASEEKAQQQGPAK